MNEFLRRLLVLPEQGSTLARGIDSLHYFVIAVTMLGAASVGAVVLYYLVRYRDPYRDQARTEEAAPDPTPGHARGGIPLWAEFFVAGGLLSLFLLWWVIGFRQFVSLQSPPPDSLPIYTTAKQWMWSFAYPNGSGSNGVLYVPVGRPVKLVMTSRDVIHSFFVPAFRVKQDVLPGRSTSVWFEAERPGRYPIYCTEYCGAGHSTMRGEVIALDGDDYDRALDRLAPLGPAGRSPAEPRSLAAMGERVAAEAGCLRCHTVDGTPHTGPTWAGLFTAEIPLQSGGVAVADEAYLTESMMDPRARVHLGFKPVMPSYRGLLTAAQVGALVEYIRSLRDRPRVLPAEPAPEPVEGDVPLVQPLIEPPGGEP
jgi:cytochrome c oxidase subunit II